ncbi:CBS domain-containing protein [Halobacillus massiliensis]|uniref:CBS domain-containing protein n=1 Tax=Halobacillus massiliensis TaxID=1926286 RepID=UPI0009E5EA3C|nr:CBS domain-containing protein [Halobacillus massiliensis]
MNELVERFELAFNQIHQHLKELNNYPKNDNFVELLNRSQDHSVIKEHIDHLKQYAKLRNAIIHEKVREDYYIAYPHEEVVEEIERIKQTFDQPPLALDIATSPVIFFYYDSELREVLNKFRDWEVSQFPIYDRTNEKFLGLLTDTGMLRYLTRRLDDTGQISVENVMAGDVLEDENVSEIKFLPNTATVFDLENLFERSYQEGRKLKAIVVTKDGCPQSEPIGIVTAWDLIKGNEGTASIDE